MPQLENVTTLAPSVLVTRLASCRMEGDRSSALTIVRELLRRFPLHVKSRLVLTELLLEDNAFADALLVCRQLLVVEPSQPGGWSHAAATWLSMHDAATSAAAWHRAFVLAPNDRGLRHAFAANLSRLISADAAIADELDRLLGAEDGSDGSIAMLRARAHLGCGNVADAERALADYLCAGGRPSAALITLWARTLATLGRFEDARRSFLSAAALSEHPSEQMAHVVAIGDWAKRFATTGGLVPAKLGHHREAIAADPICHLVIFIRHYIDLDHFTPVLWRWSARPGYHATVVVVEIGLSDDDFRMKLLKSLPRTCVLRLADLAQLDAGADRFRAILAQLVVPGCPTTVAADGSQEIFYVLLGEACIRIGLPFVALPHGEGAVLNQLMRLDLLTFADLEERTVEPIYTSYLFSNASAQQLWLDSLPAGAARPTKIVGSARYARAWVEWLSGLDHPRPSIPDDGRMRVVIFLIDSIYNVWIEELQRAVNSIVSLDGIRLVLHDHPRRHLRNDLGRDSTFTAEILAARCPRPDLVTVVPGDLPGLALIRDGDVFLSFGSSIVIEAVRLGRPVLELSFLHANHTLLARELPECDLRCRDDLLRTLTLLRDRKLRADTSADFYHEGRHWAFLRNVIDGGHDDPIETQVSEIAALASIPSTARLAATVSSSRHLAVDESPVWTTTGLDRLLPLKIDGSWVRLPSAGNVRGIVLLGSSASLERLVGLVRKCGLETYTVWDIGTEDSRRPLPRSADLAGREVWFTLADFPQFRAHGWTTQFNDLLGSLRLVEFYDVRPPAADCWVAKLVAIYRKAAGTTADDVLVRELDLLLQLASGRRRLRPDEESLSALEPLFGLLGDLGFSYLAAGRLETGWWLYEASKRRELRDGRQPFPYPMWLGEDLRGKTVLLWRNRGPGDEVLYANAIPDVVNAAGRVIVEADPRLVPLFARSFPTATVISRDDWPQPELEHADVDFQIPYASLARRLRGSLDAFPNHSGYLVPDAGRVAHWRSLMIRQAGGRQIVGVSWRTAAYGPEGDYQTKIADWSPLLARRDLFFVSLQYDCDYEELEKINRTYGWEIFAPTDIDLFNDLDDLAALIGAMDKLVTIDNLNANLAGALGVPTVQFTEPWGHPRLGQARCPFYPSQRLVLMRRDGSRREAEAAARLLG
jgi:tetratricopeptide (TPR) repeat protein